MTADTIVIHSDDKKIHASLENNRVPIDKTQISSPKDKKSLEEFSQKLGELVGFNFK